MAYTAVPTETAGNDITATKWNTYVRDNGAYFFNGRPKTSIVYVGGADVTVSSTTFVDVDATNLIMTATINNGIAEVEFGFSFTPPATTNSIMFDIILDSTTRAGNATYGLRRFGPGGNMRECFIRARFTGLSVGSHNFKLRARVDGGSGTVHNNNYPITGLLREAS